MTSRLARIARAAGLVMAAYVVSRALGMVREMVIANQFGTQPELGAYLAAFRVPDLIFQLVAGGALGSSLIPVLSGYRVQGSDEGLWRVSSAVYNLVALVTTGLALAAFLLAEHLASILVPGYSPEMRALTVDLMRIMLVTPIIFGVSGISMAVLNAHQSFLLPALAPILYNLAIIAGAAFLAPRYGVHGLAYGVVAGAFLHLLVQAPGLMRQGWRWRATLGLRDAGVREVVRLLLPRMLGLAVVQINFVVSVRLASGLSESSLPALNYAFLLMMLPQGVFAMAIATAAFPSFSDLASGGHLDELGRTLAATLRAMVFLAVPAAVGLYVLRQPLIHVLLQRGEFTMASTEAVGWALQFYAIGLPAYAVVEILSRAFYALHDTKTPVLVAALTVALNIVLSLALVGPLDIGGLALANAAAVNVEMVALLWCAREVLARDDVVSFWRAAARVLGAAAAMGAALWIMLRALSGWGALSLAAAGLALGGAIYLVAAWLLRVEEVHLFLGMMRSRIGGNSRVGA